MVDVQRQQVIVASGPFVGVEHLDQVEHLVVGVLHVKEYVAVFVQGTDDSLVAVIEFITDAKYVHGAGCLW